LEVFVTTLESFRAHALPRGADRTLARVSAIVRGGDLRVQQDLFRDAEQLAQLIGVGEVVDGWAPDLDWLRGGAK
jgi:hypothetical protein